jgi:hypothetical protein
MATNQTHHIVITSPDGVHFAGPVIETPPHSIGQDLHEDIVDVPKNDAHYAFNWATDDADEFWVEECGLSAQVWHIVDGQVTEYARVSTTPEAGK